MKTLNSHSQSRNNNFDLLRLCAATAVIFSHAYPLTGNNNIEPLDRFTHGFTTIGGLAVACFFIISGYLITASLCQRNNVVSYSIARCLRIFPGLIVALLFCIFVIGPIVTNLSIVNYLTQLFQLRGDHFILPGVFETNIYPQAVNGSLWTLPIEFMLYIFIGVMGLFKVMPRRVLASIIILVLLVPCIIEMTHFVRAIVPMACFGIGAISYLWRDKIPLNWMIMIALVILTYCLRYTPCFALLFYLSLAYTIFWIAYQPKIKGSTLTRYGDFSYGVYIYAFPVQQMIMHYFSITSPGLLFLTALPFTFLFAVLSWYLVEKPALSLKNTIALIRIKQVSFSQS